MQPAISNLNAGQQGAPYRRCHNELSRRNRFRKRWFGTAVLRRAPLFVAASSAAIVLTTIARAFCFAASAGDTNVDLSCHAEMEKFLRLSNGRAEEVSIQQIFATQRLIDGHTREESQLRWVAFGREFIVNLHRYIEDHDENDRRIGYSGRLEGSKAAEMFAFSKWPSGAWDGEIRRGLELFILRARCSDRAAGVVDPRSVMFLEDYPEKPRL